MIYNYKPRSLLCHVRVWCFFAFVFFYLFLKGILRFPISCSVESGVERLCLNKLGVLPSCYAMTSNFEHSEVSLDSVGETEEKLNY